jgi:hypothetical protein
MTRSKRGKRKNVSAIRTLKIGIYLGFGYWDFGFTRVVTNNEYRDMTILEGDRAA